MAVIEKILNIRQTPNYLQHIKETAHEDSTEQILKGHKGIRDAEEHRGQLKVHL